MKPRRLKVGSSILGLRGLSPKGLGLKGLGLAALLLLSSCATRARPGAELELLGLLDPQAIAYVRLAEAAGLALAPALLPAEEGKSLAPLLERSEALALALLGSGEGSAGPEFEAVLAGDFPRLSASLALGASKGWKKEKGNWKNEATGISARFPDGRHLLASSGETSALLERLESPLPSPLPPRLAELERAGTHFLVWLPRPLGGAEGARGIFATGLELPLRGLLIAGRALGASPAEGGESGAEESFELTVAFLMEDSGSARIYAPALRLAWYFIVRSLFPAEEELLQARFERQEEVLAAGGLRVSAAALSGALSRLASTER